MQGIPGSGKSTWAEAQPGAVIVSADRFRIDPVTGEYRNYQGAMEMAVREAEEKMILGVPWIIIDNTNIYQRQADPYLELAKRYNYQVEVERVVADPQVAYQRQLHGVPLDIIQKWARQMEDIEIYPGWKVRYIDYNPWAASHHLSTGGKQLGIPEGEIWIGRESQPYERFIMFHEITENELMRKGVPEEEAHTLTERLERSKFGGIEEWLEMGTKMGKGHLLSPTAIVVDIDGTIADVSRRLEFALARHPRKGHRFWDVFLDPSLYHLDVPIEAARKILDWYPGEIIYLSGRRAGTEDATRDWLLEHGFPLGQIHHRPKGEKTIDFKVRVIRELLRKGYNIESGWGDTEQDRIAYEEAGIPALIVPWGER